MFANPSKKVSCGDIELNVRFLVPASVIYEALTSTQAAQVFNSFHSIITSIIHNHHVQLNLSKGVVICFIMVVFKENSFHLYYFECSFNKQSDKKIELKWRRREWEDGVYSIVTIDFITIDHAVTELHIVQHDVPKYDRFGNTGVLESVKNGWIEMVFRRIGMILGYVFQTEDEFEQ